jgi:hypothetical protein
MNILDENAPESQRLLLRGKHVPTKQIGQDMGRQGMKDSEIVRLLHKLDRPTFFTLDGDFYSPRLCHEGYCVVHLDIEDDMLAEYVYRLLRHPFLNTKAKRMGQVIRAAPQEWLFGASIRIKRTICRGSLDRPGQATRGSRWLFLVGLLTGDPGLVHIAVVAQRHDAE